MCVVTRREPPSRRRRDRRRRFARKTARWASKNKLPGLNQYCLPQLRRQRQPRRPHRPRRARPKKDGRGPCGNHRVDPPSPPSAESRRVDLRSIAGHPRGRRCAGEKRDDGEPHACTAMNRFSSSPSSAVFYVFCIAGGLAVFLIEPPTTLWFSCNYELLRGYIHAP